MLGSSTNEVRIALGAFEPQSSDDLALSAEIELDARVVGSHGSLARYLDAVPRLTELSHAFDAAIESALCARCERDHCTTLTAAQCIADNHPEHADAIFAIALGFGLADHSSASLALAHFAAWQIGSLLFDRWRVLELLGNGATARVARARDELLSRPNASVEVIVKRFDDGIGGDARAHAMHEVRALLAAPTHLVSRLVALHAPRGEAAHLVTAFEPTREMIAPDDLAAAACALRRLHDAGLAHGDVKAAHIRLRDDRSVLLIDFGAAMPATNESCVEDFARLTTLAENAATERERGAHARRPFLLRATRRALARRWLVTSTLLLCVSSKSWRRKIIVRALAVLALTSALSIGLIEWRRAILKNTPDLTPTGATIAALVSTGRMTHATVDAKGNLIGVRLRLPELTALFPDSRGMQVCTGPVTFHPDGTVTILDIDGNQLSP